MKSDKLNWFIPTARLLTVSAFGGALYAAYTHWFEQTSVRASLVLGSLITGTIFAIVIGVAAIGSFDRWAFNNRQSGEGDWKIVDFAPSHRYFGWMLIPLAVLFVWAAFAALTWTPPGENLSALMLLVLRAVVPVVGLGFAYLFVTGAYRIYFVRLSWNADGIRMTHPLTRPLFVRFSEVVAAGSVFIGPYIWVETHTGRKFRFWQNEYGAVGLYRELRIRRGDRFRSKDHVLEEVAGLNDDKTR